MNFPGAALLGRLGWTVAGFGYGQVIRAVGNIVLTRLLMPEIFGVMLIVNTLRTGMELLTDIGVGQNIVADRRGEAPDFYRTAWTAQVLRGAALGLIFAVAAIPLAPLYGGGPMQSVLQLSSLILLIAGAQSAAFYIAQRRQQVRKLAMFEMALSTASMAFQIGLAFVWPSVWALVLGAIASTAMTTIASHRMVDGVRMRFHIDRAMLHDILHFGKWVFLSSLVFFIATNFDRLYLGTVVPLAVLGVFGIARGLVDMVGNLVIRIGTMIVFPAVANAHQQASDVRDKLNHVRGPLLFAAATGIALLIAVSDMLVTLIYDVRYHAAATMLPVLATGLWFTVMATLGDAVVMGMGKPAYASMANVVKLVWLLIAMPIGVAHAGIMGAVVVVALADIGRYAAVMVGQVRLGVGFVAQDMALTLYLFGAIVALREVTGLIGLTSGWSAWWPSLLQVLT